MFGVIAETAAGSDEELSSSSCKWSTWQFSSVAMGEMPVLSHRISSPLCSHVKDAAAMICFKSHCDGKMKANQPCS
jgi:hypothetical protein